MKKINFLSCAILAAAFTLGLSSCEKEDFRNDYDVDIEVPEASNAVVSISPSVIAFVNGSAKNVTNEANIQFTTPTAGADGTISATSVKITVKYTAIVEVYGETLSKEITAEETVNVPALGKGMCCILTPTIVLSVQTEIGSASPVKGTETELAPEINDISIKNETQYYYTDVNGEYEYKTGTEVDRESIEWIEKSYQNDAEINAMINAFDNIKMEKQKVSGIVVMAQSQTIIEVETLITSTEYTLKKTVSLSRAAESAEIDIVKFNVIGYIGTTDNSQAGPKSDENPNGYDVNINLEGEEHGHGHGHGNGHGDSSNAGGGIVWGE